MTKFRKRALLSSVAMLLVALVALGSATFAWYEANINVSATGMTFSTDAASGLLIASHSDLETELSATLTSVNIATASTSWGNDATLAADSDNLQPASLATTGSNAGSFFQTKAAGPASTQYTPANGTAVETSTNYIHEKVYFKLDAGSTTSANVYLNSITINAATTGAAADMASAIRVAIFNASGALIAEYAPVAVSDETVLLATGNIGDAGVTGTKDIDAASGAAGLVVSNISQSGDITKCVDIYVYLDGYDSNVYTDKAKTVNAADILTGISVGFTTAVTGA